MSKNPNNQSIVEQSIQTNHKVWNTWAKLHPDSQSYDMKTFRKTRNSLQPIELKLLGDIRGKKILHLQCHFGQDTLSLAHLGAEVTGVDISESAISYATKLSQELDLPAKFIVSDVLKLELHEKFDIVFTSYGVLCWLPDIKQWAAVIAKHLVPGGRFVMVEFHPFIGVTTDDLTGFDPTRPYISEGRPMVINNMGSYAAASDTVYVTYEFNHSLSAIFDALYSVGINNLNFKEYAYSAFACLAGLVENPVGSNQFTHPVYSGPLMFSLDAILA
ncbi:MAG: class I SAM-dependent methyltransferase [Gammaproteobacteria bacterium]|nr:class I SAM-dependent methyltransferase [Gammaproteobacteria bacterium]